MRKALIYLMICGLSLSGIHGQTIPENDLNVFELEELDDNKTLDLLYTLLCEGFIIKNFTGSSA